MNDDVVSDFNCGVYEEDLESEILLVNHMEKIHIAIPKIDGNLEIINEGVYILELSGHFLIFLCNICDYKVTDKAQLENTKRNKKLGYSLDHGQIYI